MISCNVILDILPLYIDGAVCEDTKKLVKKHLEGCENCRREAEQMKESLVLPADSETLALEADVLKRSVCGLEEKARARLMFFAAGFDLIFNAALPFFARWVRSIYLLGQPMEGYEEFMGMVNREMFEGQWNLAEISGFCLFFGAADLFCMAGIWRKRRGGQQSRRMSEPLVVLSYALKAVAIIVFVIVECFR